MSSSSSSGLPANYGESQVYINQQDWYGYQPNVAFSLVSTVAFGILGVILSVQTVRSRQWFTGILALGAFMEFAGYLTRYLVTQGSSNGIFILSYVLILVTPNGLALVNYAAVGRLLLTLPSKPRGKTWLRIPIITDAYGVFRANRIATFFFLSDVIAFFIQASSAAFLTSSNPSTVNTGLTVIKIGLAWALAFVALFFFVTIYVYVSPMYEIKKHPDVAMIKAMYVSLFATISLLLIRLIYRMVEFVDGNRGYIATHEAFFGVFDTGLVFICCVLYSLWHYGYYLNHIHFPAGVAHSSKGAAPSSSAEVEMDRVVQVAPADEGQEGDVQEIPPSSHVVVVHGSEE